VKGWVHALRSALGMSVTVLGRIQIDTLRRVADALDAELIVALLPPIAIKQELFSYTWTDMSALAPRSPVCIDELRRREIIEWE
jgi:hypothetical protein